MECVLDIGCGADSKTGSGRFWYALATTAKIGLVHLTVSRPDAHPPLTNKVMDGGIPRCQLDAIDNFLPRAWSGWQIQIGVAPAGGPPGTRLPPEKYPKKTLASRSNRERSMDAKFVDVP